MDAGVDVKLTVTKPLHAKWLSESYNYIIFSDGQEIIRDGWLRAGIKKLLMDDQNYPDVILFLTYAAT